MEIRVLPAEVCGIVSNHEDSKKISSGMNYLLLATDNSETKKDQEAFQAIIEDLNIDLLVLSPLHANSK